MLSNIYEVLGFEPYKILEIVNLKNSKYVKTVFKSRIKNLIEDFLFD